jgi:hypothetical protein
VLEHLQRRNYTHEPPTPRINLSLIHSRLSLTVPGTTTNNKERNDWHYYVRSTLRPNLAKARGGDNDDDALSQRRHSARARSEYGQHQD